MLALHPLFSIIALLLLSSSISPPRLRVPVSISGSLPLSSPCLITLQQYHTMPRMCSSPIFVHLTTLKWKLQTKQISSGYSVLERRDWKHDQGLIFRGIVIIWRRLRRRGEEGRWEDRVEEATGDGDAGRRWPFSHLSAACLCCKGRGTRTKITATFEIAI